MPRRFNLDFLKAQGDVYLPKGVGRETDIVIPIMGPTGVGKSTFVNNVLGSSEAAVSDGFKSCTKQLAHYFIDVPSDGSGPLFDLGETLDIAGNRIVLVDTPGFDDTELSDTEILRRIAVWLASSYDSNMTVGGVIYMYPIYPNRMTRNDRSNVKVFQKICGDQGLSKVILTTTRWDICPPESGAKRTKELVDTFWKEMLSATPGSPTKAEMAELRNSEDSAWSLIRLLLKRRADSNMDGVILTIQKQIVDKSKKLKNTDAAQELRRKLQDLLKESGSSSTEARKEKLRALAAEAAKLRLPLGSRIKKLLGLEN